MASGDTDTTMDFEERTPMELDQVLGRQALTIATTTPVKDITPTELKVLVKDTSRVEIKWRGEHLTDGTHDLRIISNDYPASVAYAFSEFCAARMRRFLQTDKSSGLATCGSSGDRPGIMINGPKYDYEACCKLFACLLEYCRGGGSAPLPGFLPYPLLQTLKLEDVAYDLGVNFLQRRLEHKLTGLRRTVPSAGELSAIIQYCRRDTYGDVGILETCYHFMVDHIATAIVTGRLSEDDPHYVDVFAVMNDAENDPFGDDVSRTVEKKRASIKAITSDYNEPPNPGKSPVVEQAWARARAEIERLQARESSRTETSEEGRATGP